jgi:hypothetical protein
MMRGDGSKGLTPRELIAALEQLPEDSTVDCNLVGNLLVSSAEGDYIGYIDFDTGKFKSLP